MRHGEEMHLIRPDGVYITSVLTAIPGYQPIMNAQDVAARFTAIWQPRVQDALSGPGLGERPLGLIERARLWMARQKFKAELRKRGMSGPDDTAMAIPTANAPQFNRQEQAALAISMRAVTQGAHPFPPVLNPAAAAAANITPIAYAPAALSRNLIDDRMGGMVGARANAAGMYPFVSSQSPGWTWSRGS